LRKEESFTAEIPEDAEGREEIGIANLKSRILYSPALRVSVSSSEKRFSSL
jgi:hypothetical protein